MSIKAIDTQIMITRLSDSVREASAMHKRPEMAQDLLATRQRINDAEQQSRVAKTTESEMEQVRTDVDEGGNGSGGYEGDGGSNQDEKDRFEEPGKDLYVPAGNYLIDISI